MGLGGISLFGKATCAEWEDSVASNQMNDACRKVE